MKSTLTTKRLRWAGSQTYRMSNGQTKKVAIIGAGQQALLLLDILVRNGVKAVVFDRYPGDRWPANVWYPFVQT